MEINKNIFLVIILLLIVTNVFLIYNQWNMKEHFNTKINKLHKELKKLEVESLQNHAVNITKEIKKENITKKMYETLEKQESSENTKEQEFNTSENNTLEKEYTSYKEDFNNTLLSDELKKEIDNLDNAESSETNNIDNKEETEENNSEAEDDNEDTEVNVNTGESVVEPAEHDQNENSGDEGEEDLTNISIESLSVQF